MKTYYAVFLTVKIIYSHGSFEQCFCVADFSILEEAEKVAEQYRQLVNSGETFCSWCDGRGYLQNVVVKKVSY